jgi:hypothetical protein
MTLEAVADVPAHGFGAGSLPEASFLSARLWLGHALDVFDFPWGERLAVGSEDVVEGGLGLGGVELCPGVPWIDRLGLAGDKAPALCADVLALHLAEVRFEGAAAGAGHVFGAEDRAEEAFQILDALG